MFQTTHESMQKMKLLICKDQAPEKIKKH